MTQPLLKTLLRREAESVPAWGVCREESTFQIANEMVPSSQSPSKLHVDRFNDPSYPLPKLN